MENLTHKYGQYCRPAAADLLEKIRMDKVYHRSAGDHLFHHEGQEEIKVIDFLGGYGASIFGHHHPALVEIMKDSINQKVPFNAQASIRSYAARLGEKLNQLLHERTQQNFVTTLANTGAEAVEAAIKHTEFVHHERIQQILEELDRKAIQMARKLNESSFQISPEVAALLARYRATPGTGTAKEILQTIQQANVDAFLQTPYFISLDRSFHGKTNGALQLTQNPVYRRPFKRLGISTIFVKPEVEGDLQRAIQQAEITYYKAVIKPGNLLDVEQVTHTNITAMFIEPIQGEGGIRPISADYLELCRNYADHYQFALVFDEIQSGMGRTGTFLASESSGVVADYYLLGKSLGGGLSKISAMMVQEDQYLQGFGMIHTSTSTEDDWSARIALKSLELLEEDRVYSKCKVRGAFLTMLLHELKAKHPELIKDVTGKGLMIGLQFYPFANSNSFVLRALAQQKLLGYVMAGFMLNNFNIRVAPGLSSSATLRLEPSYGISKQDCVRLFEALDQLCQVLKAENSYHLLGYTLGLKTLRSDEEIEDFSAMNLKNKADGIEEDIVKVGFIGHFIHADHLALWDPSFERFTSDQRKALLERFHGAIQPCVYDQITVESKTGDKIQFNFIGLFIDSDLIMRGLRNKEGEIARELVENAVKLAEKEGFKSLGFGGFSSIVSRNCKNVDSWDLAVTTGNSYTVASGVQAMFHAANLEQIDLDQSHLAAIGANGNICSIYCELMAQEIGQITLISRPGREQTLRSLEAAIYEQAYHRIKFSHESRESLTGVAKAIYSTEAVSTLLQEHTPREEVGTWIAEALEKELGMAKPVHITSDLECLRQANLIVAASNSPDPIIFPNMLGAHPTIICDIAVPQDVDPSVQLVRNDVKVIGGGVIELPCTPKFQLGGVPLQQGEAYACMSETMLMGLSGIKEHFSRGVVEKEKVNKMAKLAAEHGFTIGKLKTERSF